MDNYAVTLPGGFLDKNGKLHRDVELSVLAGNEEEWLANSQLSPAAMTTYLLKQCVQRIGEIQPVNKQHVRQLLVSDREFLLLKLRQNTFGDRIQSNLPCPWPECHHKIDIDFNISDIPITASPSIKASYEIKLDASEHSPTVNVMSKIISFRLPNGSDQEAITQFIDTNESLAMNQLLRHCLLSIDNENPPTAISIDRLTLAERFQIERSMEAIAPNLDLTMELSCPHCKRSFVAPFEIQDFFFGELRTDLELLFRETHYLAFHYHWSESEILSMPRQKRRKYIEILADEIERINNASS